MEPTKTATKLDSLLKWLQHQRQSPQSSIFLVSPHEDIAQVADEMTEHGCTSAIVIDEESEPVGHVHLSRLTTMLLGDETPRTAAPAASATEFDDDSAIAATTEGFHGDGPSKRTVAEAMEPWLRPQPNVRRTTVTEQPPATEHTRLTPVPGSFAASSDLDNRWLQTRSNGLILVIEDDAAVATSVCELLEDEGYNVIVASDGVEAMSILRALPTAPGLILLDLMMPRMDGWRFRKLQASDESIAAIPVVVMTAHAHRFDGAQLNHPRALIRKPVTAELLIDTVARHYGLTN